MDDRYDGDKKTSNMDVETQDDIEINSRVYEEVNTQSGEINRVARINKRKIGDPKSVKYIYYVLGVLEVFFTFRFVFKILGANTENTFVSFLYSFTDIFIAPFKGIFRFAVSDGIETKSVFEPTLIIAMIVYALLAWGIVKLIEINRKRNTPQAI